MTKEQLIAWLEGRERYYFAKHTEPGGSYYAAMAEAYREVLGQLKRD